MAVGAPRLDDEPPERPVEPAEDWRTPPPIMEGGSICDGWSTRDLLITGGAKAFTTHADFRHVADQFSLNRNDDLSVRNHVLRHLCLYLVAGLELLGFQTFGELYQQVRSLVLRASARRANGGNGRSSARGGLRCFQRVVASLLRSCGSRSGRLGLLSRFLDCRGLSRAGSVCFCA